MSTDKYTHDEQHSDMDKEYEHNAAFDYDEANDDSYVTGEEDHQKSTDEKTEKSEDHDGEQYHFNDGANTEDHVAEDSDGSNDSDVDNVGNHGAIKTRVNNVIEQAAEYAMKVKDSFQKLSKPQRRIIIIVVGLVCLLVVLHLFALMGEKSKSKSKLSQQQAKPSVTMNVMPGSSKYVSPNEITNLQQKVSGQFEAVVSQANRNQQAVQDVQQQLQQMREAISNLSGQQKAMQDQFTKFNQQAFKLLSANKSTKKSAVPAKIIVPIVYHLEAIEPGRAWIIDSNGNSNTVRVGDKLPQYGRVMDVNSDDGKVLTSSGKIITYGMEDS